jgi:hypothetical protein
MNAKMPAGFARELIKDMPMDTLLGRWFYVVPWAIEADNNNDLWIRTDYVFMACQYGTCCVKVKRNKEGYILNFKDCRKELENVIGGSKLNGNYSPVVKLEL